MSAVLAVGGKHFRSFRHRDDVFVARYRPKSTAVVFGIPGDRRFAPKPREDLMWDAIAVESVFLRSTKVVFIKTLRHPRIFARIPFWSLHLQLPY